MTQLRGNQLNIQDIADDPTMTSTFATGAHTHVEADITNLQPYLLTETDPVFLAQKGVANGVATLGAAATGTQAEIVGYVGSSAAAVGNSLSRTGDAYLLKEGTHSTNMWNNDWNDVTVNLDVSKQLWYNTIQVVQADTTIWFELILVGYHQ